MNDTAFDTDLIGLDDELADLLDPRKFNLFAIAGLIEGTDGPDPITGLGPAEVIVSFAGDDSILGAGGGDLIDAGADDDNVSGGTGFDAIFGGTGDDTLSGDQGNDILAGLGGDDSLFGGSGNDILADGGAEDGIDFLDGGTGVDTVDLSLAVSGQTVDLDINSAIGGGIPGQEGGILIPDPIAGNTAFEVLLDVENIVGSDFDDFLLGNREANTILAGGGDDLVFATEGTDFLDGGDGNDFVRFDTPGGVTASLRTGIAGSTTIVPIFSTKFSFHVDDNKVPMGKAVQ